MQSRRWRRPSFPTGSRDFNEQPVLGAYFGDAQIGSHSPARSRRIETARRVALLASDVDRAGVHAELVHKAVAQLGVRAGHREVAPVYVLRLDTPL
jgi:hypothetical protein